MKIEIMKDEEMGKLSNYSLSVGNIPLLPGQSIGSVLMDGNEIAGFAAVQLAMHAAGSYVAPDFRGKKWSYQLRNSLEDSLRGRGYLMYFSVPGNDCEKTLFAKYGPVKESTVQIKEL